MMSEEQVAKRLFASRGSREVRGAGGSRNG